jgi:hypothetical protein
MRKPPLSVRSKKIAKGPPPTPARIPSQIRAWNQGSTDDAGPSNFEGEIPDRPLFKAHILDSPKVLRAPKSPEKTRRSAMLPGFQNSFINSSPVRRSHARSDEGRRRANDGWNEGDTGKGPELSPFPTYQPHLASIDPSPTSPPRSPTKVKRGTEDADIRMGDAAAVARVEDRAVDTEFTRDVVLEDGDVEMINEDEDGSSEVLDPVEAPDWKQEVCVARI